ncbi:MAG: DNA methyltransferase [Acidobacteria bacterium]|nr:DNA methyltransferase [Acidobacteriota bacterium]
MATNEPRRVECGAPDYVISRKSPHGPVTLGHIECKDVGADLNKWEREEQLKRYLSDLPNRNLILTDYLEFRWYVGGEFRRTARLARVSNGHKLTPEKDGGESVTELLTAFLSREAEQITDPKTLALRMARLTHFIRDMIISAFENKSASATLRDLHGAFEKALIPDLPIAQFADMFAQTLAYGLFAARVNHHGPRGSFKRLGAASEIPKTNPFLRQLFDTITGTALDDEPYAGFVDDLAQLLADAEMDAVLADFGKRTARQDPVVHFYETFLAAYDPKLREARGVYYTPEPVVSYLVRSVDYILKTRFGCAKGLADTATIEYEREDDSVAAMSSSPSSGRRPPLQKATSPRVLILDPACGTGTFLYSVIDHIRHEFMRQGNAGMWSGYVRNHLLPRIFGFELLMAPYAVAHFKLGMQLAGHDLTPAQQEKWAYDFSGDERLGVYLTNTLEEAERRAETLFGPLRVITQEANAASKIKRDLPILAVIGNPPYSGHSANRSWEIKKGKRVPTFIGNLILDYYKVDGQPLGERNPKWLQDDYVKFIRWGQWRIEQSGAGVLAFITNHGYLDNPTFRGMRQSLMNAFTEIYALNLHGNSKKKEKCPDGSPDENVFDIQQGVTLGIFIKERDKAGPAKVFHADLWGLREDKYKYLFEYDIEATQWTELSPCSPGYLFIPQEKGLRAEYDAGWKITDIMPINSLGIATARDSLAVQMSKAEMLRVARDFTALPAEEARGRYGLGDDVRDWKVSLAQADLREHGIRGSDIKEILYRPFDARFTYYTGKTRGFHCMPRREVMAHILAGKNVGLCTTRSTEIERGWEHVLCSRGLIQLHTVSLKEVNYLFPLYLYSSDSSEQGQRKLSESAPDFDGMRPNLEQKFAADLTKRLGLGFTGDGTGDLKKTFGPEDVFNYIYAVFHSPTYRSRYAEFLKSDFPRVPLTSDVKLFRTLCVLGADLVALHLLESPMLLNPIARYPVKGSNVTEKGFPKYVAPAEPEPGTGKPVKEGRIYINRGTGVPPVGDRGQDAHATGQYFEGVPPEVWQFHIGGYQVCEKWLKDRRGRTLTYDDQMHYCKVVTAINETIRLMAEIDAAIPKWPIV